MKKILNEWRNYISEQSVDPLKTRIEIGKKMNKYLFGTHHNAKGSEILSRYTFLHWAIYGTKQEREEGQRQYRPDVGMEFASEKVNLFLKYLEPEEIPLLLSDIPHLVSLLRSGNVPEFPVQLPVELTGHEGVDPSFRVPYVGRRSIDDWGMGGSLRDPSGQNYIFTILEMIANKLPNETPAEPLTKEEVRATYFMAEKPSKPEKPARRRNPFSSLATSGMSYEDMIQKLKGG